MISFLDRAYTHIKTAMPHCVCPACQGVMPVACNACRGRGLMCEDVLKRMPREMREAAEAGR